MRKEMKGNLMVLSVRRLAILSFPFETVQKSSVDNGIERDRTEPANCHIKIITRKY